MGPNEPKDKEDADLLRRSKISPHLWAMIADWERRGRSVTPARAKGATPSGIPLAPVLIEMKTADTSALVRAGIQFQHLVGLFYSALVPLDKIEPLADIDGLEHVHSERQMKPDLDESIPEIHCNTVRNSQPPFSGTNKYTGLGVVVGIIDSGINILHPVFRDPANQSLTRIFAILDQTATVNVNPTYGGAVFDMAAIEAAIAAGRQIMQPGNTGNSDHKHGTHVASIAAGNGHIAGNCHGRYTFVGVAPEAILVVVKYAFNSSSLARAMQFVVDQAALLPLGPRPAVINMSFGSSIGPHDGTDQTDQIVDTWLASRPAGSGTVVLVASAGTNGGHGGNVAGDDSHATGTIPAGGVAKLLHFNLNAQTQHSGQLITSVEIRFTAPNGVACKLTPPGNNINITAGSNTAAADGAQTTFTEVTQNSTCTITPSVINVAANTRRINISITSAAAGKNQPGDWTIELTNAGGAPIVYHAWLVGDQFERFADDLSRANTIGSPGSSRTIITVGNYVKGKNKGQIADSSSRGPLLDAPTFTQKPDLCAPGETITAARRDFHDGCCCDCCCDSYIGEFGTSMSAPHVTGAVALMLERNPALTHAQAKSVLMDTARKDGFTGTTNNSTYGNGKLDVVTMLNDPRVKQGLPDVTGAEMYSFQRRQSLAEQAALAGSRLPQIEEGAPLWRLLRTEEGQRLYELGRDHWEEARMLINTRKRIATVWHRNHGPLMIHHVIRAVMIPDVALPKEVEGEAVSIRAARLVTALEKHASPELRAALHTALPWVARLEGKTLMDVVELLEARELQNA